MIRIRTCIDKLCLQDNITSKCFHAKHVTGVNITTKTIIISPYLPGMVSRLHVPPNASDLNSINSFLSCSKHKTHHPSIRSNYATFHWDFHSYIPLDL